MTTKDLRSHAAVDADPSAEDPEDEYVMPEIWTPEDEPEPMEANPEPTHTSDHDQDGSDPKAGNYVAVVYKGSRRKSYVYMALLLSIQEDVIRASFMHKVSGNVYKWPEKDDIWEEDLSNVLFIAPEPEAVMVGTRIQYRFNFSDAMQLGLKEFDGR